jgi:hypothetical protein
VLGTVVWWGLLNGRFFLETFGSKPFQWPVPSKERKNGPFIPTLLNQPFFSMSKFRLRKSKKSSDWEGVNCQNLFQLGHISIFGSMCVAKQEVIGRVSIAKIFLNLAIFVYLVLSV